MLAMWTISFTACAQDPIPESETQPTTMRQNINLVVNGHTLTATLEDNVASRHLVELLQKGDITIDAHDYGGWEKVGILPEHFPSDNKQLTTQPGDFVLYSGNQFVLFYDSNSWSYTRFGHLDGVSQSELKQILGGGNTTITLSLINTTAVKSNVSNAAVCNKTIYTLNGKCMAQTGMDSLPHGTYIIRETLADGTINSKKIRL